MWSDFDSTSKLPHSFAQSKIVMSMDAPKAAQVLAEMHYEDAAMCLLVRIF